MPFTIRKSQAIGVHSLDPTLLQGARPTRSEIPVLFPFPTHIRDGKFT